MDDALGVRCVERVGDLDAEVSSASSSRGSRKSRCFSGAVEKFHGDEGQAVLLVDFVDGADIG